MSRAAAALLLLAGCMGQPQPQQGAPLTKAQRALTEANARMHAGMAVTDRDPDIAFARGMTAHHRGAVEMAQIELRHGRDPELRALARRIIDAQAGEIAQMERWLARHGAGVANPSTPHPH